MKFWATMVRVGWAFKLATWGCLVVALSYSSVGRFFPTIYIHGLMPILFGSMGVAPATILS